MALSSEGSPGLCGGAGGGAAARQTFCYVLGTDGSLLYADSCAPAAGAVAEALRTARSEGNILSEDGPFCVRCAGGSLEIHALRGLGWLCLYHTDTHAAEHSRIAALLEKNRELADIVDASNDGIVIADGEGRYSFCNPSYLRISGLAWDDIIGRTAQEMIELGLVDTATAPTILRTGKPVIFTQTFHTGVRTSISGSPLRDADGHIRRVVVNLRDTTELEALREELAASRDKLDKVSAVVENLQDQKRAVLFTSPAMRKIHTTAHTYAQVNAPLLISGETGVGKEVIADLVHRLSPRATQPFLKINCAAIPEQLLESELFGYEGGAFTGARHKGRIGLLEMADGGMVFLDEVNSLSVDLQAKLLRFLQQQEFYRIGGNRLIRVDVRLVAATNRDLEAMMHEGGFRSDFFYRLHVLQIVIPPLRERPEDIPPLLNMFLAHFNNKYKALKSLAPETIRAMQDYDWPGNVRELENMVERMVITSGSPLITRDMLPEALHGTPGAAVAGAWYRPERDAFESRFWTLAARQARTTRELAAAVGVTHATVINKMRRYGIRHLGKKT